ncbi:MAG TPA: CPBP family intramembrane glutamic endopeptidase [Acidothermaceae bacterium]
MTAQDLWRRHEDGVFMRFAAPPGWPQPPAGWQPPPGWLPDPTWPPAPYGWRFWSEPTSPRRRKGFRGWAASMLPPTPTPRRPTISVSPRRAWAEVLGVFAMFFLAGVLAAVFYDAHHDVNPTTISVYDGILAAISHLAIAAMAIVVVCSLTRLRGLSFSDIGLAPAWRTHRAYRWQGFGVGMMFIGAVTVSALLLHLVSPHAKYPFLPVAVWHLIYEIPAALEAGIVEELVVVALLVTALEQARTKVWLIFVVGIALRLSYHVYYGPGVIVFVLWAAAAIWLFRRTRRITPLIVAHALYDAFGAFAHEVPHPPFVIGELLGLVIIALPIVVIVRAIQIALRGRRPAGR